MWHSIVFNEYTKASWNGFCWPWNSWWIEHQITFNLWSSSLVYTIPSDQCKVKLESIQRSATRVIFPDLAYEDRLELLMLPTLNDFIFSICKKHFDRICSNPDQPLYTQITFSGCKTSSRSKTTFRPAISKTQKRSKSFFNHLWDFLIIVIRMLIEWARLYFVSSPFSFIPRFFLQDIEWQIKQTSKIHCICYNISFNIYMKIVADEHF